MRARCGRCCGACESTRQCMNQTRDAHALQCMGVGERALNSFGQSIVAITFNSTAIGVGRQLISSVVRVGLGFPSPAKNSAYSLLYVAKSSFMFVRNTVTSTIFSHVEPASSST